MKTKEQILKWMDEQPWKGEFYEAAFFDRGFPIIYDEYFICGAFDWSATKSGAGIWKQRDIVFRQWYDSNDKPMPNDKPMSWEEYCEQNPIKEGECCINRYSDCSELEPDERHANTDATVMSKDLCEAFIAYMKLIQLRNAWVKDGDENLYRIVWSPSKDCWCFYGGWNGLSFPTASMAEEFVNTFKDLLDVAKPLI